MGDDDVLAAHRVVNARRHQAARRHRDQHIADLRPDEARKGADARIGALHIVRAGRGASHRAARPRPLRASLAAQRSCGSAPRARGHRIVPAVGGAPVPSPRQRNDTATPAPAASSAATRTPSARMPAARAAASGSPPSQASPRNCSPSAGKKRRAVSREQSQPELPHAREIVLLRAERELVDGAVVVAGRIQGSGAGEVYVCIGRGHRPIIDNSWTIHAPFRLHMKSMLYPVIRPILFSIDPERAHRLALDALRVMGRLATPVGGWRLRRADGTAFSESRGARRWI